MMKKIIFILSSIIILSCSNNEQSQEIVSNSHFLSPKAIGSLHNEAMSNFKDNFEVDVNSSEITKIENVINFNQTFLKSRYNEFSSVIPLSENIALFDTDKLAAQNFYSQNNNTAKTAEMNIYNKNEYLYNEKVIDVLEYSILNRLTKLHQDNYEKKISDTELKMGVIELKTEFEELSKDLNIIGSYYTAITLEVALSSNEWWEKNYSTQARKSSVYSKSLVAPWVAADVIGGLGSGFVNLIKQGIRNGGSGATADAGEVGMAMLEGAITSSIAPWSKIAKLF